MSFKLWWSQHKTHLCSWLSSLPESRSKCVLILFSFVGNFRGWCMSCNLSMSHRPNLTSFYLAPNYCSIIRFFTCVCDHFVKRRALKGMEKNNCWLWIFVCHVRIYVQDILIHFLSAWPLQKMTVLQHCECWESAVSHKWPESSLVLQRDIFPESEREKGSLSSHSCTM